MPEPHTLDGYDLADYAQLKREITQRVRALGLDMMYPVTGDRNYVLESDGSCYMHYAGRHTPVSRWTREDWAMFADDCRHGRLWPRLEAIAAALAAPHRPII